MAFTHGDGGWRIPSFDGPHAFLSNFAHSRLKVTMFGASFFVPTVEHGYQASKTDNVEQAFDIINAATPGEAKRLGRRVTMRPNFEERKQDVMLGLLRLKFQDEWMREHLLETGHAQLTEGNTWHDNYWGDCVCQRCRHTLGVNALGHLLTQVRAELRVEAAHRS